MFIARVCSLLLLALVAQLALADLTVLESELLGVKEALKISTIKLNALSSRHTLEMTNTKKEIELMRKDIRALLAAKSEGNTLDISSLEWAHESVDSLRAEMGVLRGEMSDIRVELAAARAALNATDHDRSLMETKRDIEYTRNQQQVSEKDIETLKEQINVLTTEYRMTYKSLNSLTKLWAKNQMAEPKEPTSDCPHKVRHYHLMVQQMRDLRHSQWKLTSLNTNMSRRLMELEAMLMTVTKGNPADCAAKIEALEQSNFHQKQMMQNISIEVNNFNKLHTSMLELLENMENLEEKVDTTLPQFQREISKLDVDMAQLNAHHENIKSNQENIRQSVKAIAVSVSNMVDRVDEDHQALRGHNKTISYLQSQAKMHFNRLADHITKSEAQNAYNGSVLDVDDMPELIDELKELKKVEAKYENIITHLPYDCSAIEGSTGNALVGPGSGPAVETHCERGWTLVQSRFNGSIDFNRKYKEYANGFGTPDGEFWIGNEALHRLTKNNCTSLRIRMQDIYGNYLEANYKDFRVGPASSGYRLFVGGFSGNATDALDYQNNMEFSTVDHDRDIANTNCAAGYEGGWWFSHCQHANLNGKYLLGLTWFNGETNEWIAISSSRIALRNEPGCAN